MIVYPKIFRQNTLEKLKASGEAVSIAVMPFQNMTNDTVWNIWQNGIQNELINNLTNSKELQVRQSESVTGLIQSRGITNTASLTPSVAGEISKKLNASIFVHGSIKQVGNTIRVNAQLIDSNTEEIFKSFQIDGTEDKILHITDSLSAMIRDFLIITVMEKEIIKDFRPLITTNSSEAYKYYMYGNQAYYKYDYPTATEWYKKAVDIDSTFSEAIRMLAYSLSKQALYEEAGKWILKNYQRRNQMPEQGKLWAEIQYAQLCGTPDEVIKYFKLLVSLDDEMPVPHGNFAGAYIAMGLYDNAILELEKQSEIYKKWGIKERWSNTPIDIGLGGLYHKTGQYKKEKKLYNEIEKDYPDYPDLIYRQAVLALSEGKTKKANEYIDRYISVSKKNSASEVQIASNLAGIYYEADIPDKAEEYYRKALSLEPENLTRIRNLAFFLIENDRNVKQGLDLVERVLKLNPDDYSFLDCKGWGLYKAGRYNEALEILQKSWELRGGYNHDAFLRLEEVKKAVANKN
jgi:TolB-like protein/Tfp pilus assembly protein PilF